MSASDQSAKSLYAQPHQFEPLLPQVRLEPLIERTRDVFEKSLRVTRAAHPHTLDAVRELVRNMNSYYSNLIEGQGTHPANIDRALKADFSGKPDVARRQRIALAHIEAERELEVSLREGDVAEANILRSDFLVRAHRSLYSRLDSGDRTTKDDVIVVPGEIRNLEVIVGDHVAPAHRSIVAFLSRMDEVYGRARGVDMLLCHISAEHQRAAWVHPFVDGNGRACRLQTHCALFRMSEGLWSVNRGLARQRDKYYQMLQAADAQRRGDLDGRGNLSEAGLRAWCEFFIELCDDQVSFMAATLELDLLKDRIASLVAMRTESSQYANYRRETMLPLHHVAIAGELSRGDFVRMMGIPERTAQRSISQLLGDGLLVSSGPKSALRFGIPLDSLSVLFPGLYPEASTKNDDA